MALDNSVSADWAAAEVQRDGCVQGNLDPLALMASPEQVAAEARQVLHSWGRPQAGSGHVFNLGHGILPDTPIAHVEALVRRVRGG